MKIHHIGIGGIGVSALARYYLAKGYQVSGSDLVDSEITESLDQQGAEIFTGHSEKNLSKDTDLVVYSQAIPEHNPELKKAKRLGIKTLTYPQALGELTKEYFTIAVAGAHGKGTTTAMISLILIKAGLDPTVILGTKLEQFGNTNCRVGESEFLVIEADEYKGAFLNYKPEIIVLTNIDREHLDYFKNLNHIIKTFAKFISHLSEDGVLIANQDNQNIVKLLNRSKAKLPKIKTYSLKQKEVQSLKQILKIPGEHIVSDALAALTCAQYLGIEGQICFKALSEYQGAWRRFEIKKLALTGYGLPVTVVSDYAHHPTEIEATLKGVKEKFPQKEIWCVFQPHQFQRTFYLFDQFKKVLSQAPVEKLILIPIYSVAGREQQEIEKKVSSKKLVKAINRESKGKALFLKKQKVMEFLKKNLNGEEVIVIMGAGDVYKLCKI